MVNYDHPFQSAKEFKLELQKYIDVYTEEVEQFDTISLSDFIDVCLVAENANEYELFENTLIVGTSTGNIELLHELFERYL